MKTPRLWPRRRTLVFALASLAFGVTTTALAQSVSIDLGGGEGLTGRIVQLVLLVTLLSVAPSILIMATSFVRIVVVLSLLRTAIGLQQSPPNTVIVSLALLLTAFIMIAALEDRNNRQISVCLMMALITSLNIAYGLTGEWFYLVTMTHAYMIGVALIIFRIGMAMGFHSLQQAGPKAEKLSYIQNPYYRNLNIICMYLYVFSLLFVNDTVFSSWLALASGLSMIARLRDWHHAILWHASYVRWHYLTLLCIGIGYCWLGISGILSWGIPTQALHFILIGGFIFMVMQIFNIAGLLHSGRELPFPLTSQWALTAILLAAILRSISLNFGWNYALFSLAIPSALLIIAFALYIPVFWRIFISTETVPPSPRS